MEKFCEGVCDSLQSTERTVRVSALNKLLDFLNGRGDDSSDDVVHLFDECYLHILKCYSDRYESCREKSALIVNAFIKLLPINDYYLQNIVVTMASRIGQPQTLEHSEEIRFIYVCQLNALIKRYSLVANGKALGLLYDEMNSILIRRLADGYPAIQKEACTCIVNLSSCADHTFQSYAEQLIKSLFSILNHKHSQNRIAAIEALGSLSSHVNPNSDLLHKMFTEISPLLMDSMPLVRKECGLLGCKMLLDLKDRYSYFDRIIPLVLCCLKDESQDVRNCIKPLWENCGKLYYEENETELRKLEIADILPDNYPIGVTRPSMGCRGLVQRSLRLLNLIMRESSDWKENVRLHSMKLLYQFVLHAETAMTAKFFEIYPDLARACQDNDPVVASEALKVADLMGRVFIYEDWKDHAIEGLQNNAKEGYLKCFCYMYLAACGNSADRKDVLKLSQIFVEPKFSQTLKSEIQSTLLRLIEGILGNISNVNIEQDIGDLSFVDDEFLKNLYVTTIKIMALTFEKYQKTEQTGENGMKILEKIAKMQNINVGKLHENYLQFALDDVNLDARLDAFSEPILLLYGLLRICQFRATYLKILNQKIKLVWENCADEAKIKIFSAISIAMLSWKETINKELGESAELLKKFLNEVVVENLTWKAGANAESMRSFATATLCAVSQGASEEAKEVLPLLAKYFPSLLDDHAISTRNYALKCLMNFGQVKVEVLKPIAYAILQRLDDPSSDVRELAASVVPCLTPLFIEEEADNDYKRATWMLFIEKTLDMFFLHYDGPDIRLKRALRDSILVLGKQFPEIYKECYDKAYAVSYNKSEISEINKSMQNTE